MNTPGPWIVDCDDPLHIIEGKGLCSVATVTDENLDDARTGRADAMLIAAAPELADALAGARDILATHLCPFGVALLPVNRTEGRGVCDCNFHDIARAVEAALCKAGRIL